MTPREELRDITRDLESTLYSIGMEETMSTTDVFGIIGFMNTQTRIAQREKLYDIARRLRNLEDKLRLLES